MRVVAYSSKDCEKELLIRTNNKKHQITLISDRLSPDTVAYAKGKDAVLVLPSDDLSSPVLNTLKDFGVAYIGVRAADTSSIDLAEAEKLGIEVAGAWSNVCCPQELFETIARKTIENLDSWQMSKMIGVAI